MALDFTAGSKWIIVIGRAILIASACLYEAGCHRMDSAPEEPQVENAKALARTISMLRGGEGANTQYRVLFYGQSITSRKWTDLASKNIARNYPKVNFLFSNMAIGGNAASLLKRAVARDIEQFYPDLVVFHVYGGEQDYDDIVRMIRSRSAAEVILQTDHLTAPPEPLCPVGLNVTFKTPLGCTGTVWLHQHNWDDYMSGAVIPRTAARYGAAIDPRRSGWNNYLKRHHLEPSQLLQDGVHPNDEGWRLAAALFTTSFSNTIQSATPTAQNLVNVVAANQTSLRRLRFSGNRLEIITSEPIPDRIESTIDGIASAQLPGCWIATRVSSVPWIPEWPALRQVSISDRRLEPDEWTLRLDKFNDNLTNFRFRIYSKAHGFDGEGNGQDNFVSNSGLIKIDANDWTLGYSMKARPVTAPKALTLHWSRLNMCGYRPNDQARVSSSEYHYIIATGLKNTDHVATVVVPSNTYRTIKAFISYRPWATR